MRQGGPAIASDRLFERTDDSVTVRVRLTPRADRDAVDGVRTLSDGSEVLAARVRAIADKGKANKALEALLAATFGLPKSAVSLRSGHTARIKTVRLEGDPNAIEATCRALPAA
ncbi:DUF167 family protein [Amorphus sp. MBR-141]